MLGKMKKILITALASVSFLSFSNSFAVDSTGPDMAPQNVWSKEILVIANGHINLNHTTSPGKVEIPYTCPPNFKPWVQLALKGKDTRPNEPTQQLRTFSICATDDPKTEGENTVFTYQAKGYMLPTAELQKHLSSGWNENTRVWGMLGGNGVENFTAALSANYTLYCYPIDPTISSAPPPGREKGDFRPMPGAGCDSYKGQ